MNDFDFLAGTWDVANRRRTDYLDPASEWEEFPGISHASRHFDGGASFDEFEFPTRNSGGLTLRLYDAERDEWTLTWAGKGIGRLEPPVVGRFVNGRGEFFGDDTFAGTPVRVRYIWSDVTADSARWEQAFSTDGGQSWITNWVMTLTRR
ncbi:MAG TPA: hypothetical protein VH912_31795 [Streptosporangiaceae bacterium]|jgi:hypothetical protein